MHQWYYVKSGQQLGPVSIEELKTLINAGDVSGEDLVWHEGMEQWTAARKLKELFTPPEEGTSDEVSKPATKKPIDRDDPVYSRGRRSWATEDDEERRRPTRVDDRDDFDDEYIPPTRRKRRSSDEATGQGLAIASLVCGIIGLPAVFCCFMAIPLPIIAIVLGAFSLKTSSRGMGMAGLILGILGLVLLFVVFFLGIAVNNF